MLKASEEMQEEGLSLLSGVEVTCMGREQVVVRDSFLYTFLFS